MTKTKSSLYLNIALEFGHFGHKLGFGKMGEGFFRLTAFGSRENTIEAMERIINGLKK